MENNCKNNEQIPPQGKNELAFAFAERMVKRLWIALIATGAFLFSTNLVWIWAWCQSC